ncbi:hypothetical protein L6452_31495 [Arctium lappa]|uniref:Uncharacterized protein n=1 Tax=Arctium lappa TaxID=4217 RepID=A0ACB8Z263_ARCLA|nr:hypothetical protein L6452_31495 [Arctium lappa]
MDSRNLIRFLFLFFIIAVVLLLTRINIPFSDKPENLTENRFLQSNLKQPSKPTTIVVAHRHASVVPHHPLDPLTVTKLLDLRSTLLSHVLFRNSKDFKRSTPSFLILRDPLRRQ